MARARGRNLVIDASVAGAAGDREATPSRACTDFLEALRALNHRVSVSTPLLQEWHRHHSRFAGTWLLSMYARRRVDAVEVKEDTALRESLETAAPRPRIAAALLKDAHLIEVALKSDRRIVALDDQARIHFGQAAQTVRVLLKICWVNPAGADEQAVKWLHA